MLDLNDPHAENIFRAAWLLDSILKLGRIMTVAPSAERFRLLSNCRVVLTELKDLNAAHFGNSPFISKGIADLEAGLESVAQLGGGTITADGRDGSGVCPACTEPVMKIELSVDIPPGTKIGDREFGPMRVPPRTVITCPRCDLLFHEPRVRLESLEGFGIEAI